jgi:hypothetical protein
MPHTYAVKRKRGMIVAPAAIPVIFDPQVIYPEW